MMVGAFGKQTISIATKYADIIHCIFEPTEAKLKEQKAKIIEGCKKHNRDPDSIRIGAGYSMWIDPTPYEVEKRLAMMVQRYKLSQADAKKVLDQTPSTPEEHIENIRQLADQGIGLFTFTGNPAKIQEFSDTVLKKL